MFLKHCFLVFLAITAVAFAEVNLMSVYHYSETTFINLKPRSREIQVEFLYHSNVRNETDLKELSTELGKSLATENIQKNNEAFEVTSDVMGKVEVHPTKTVTKFFDSPNGFRSQQGWISSKDEYPTDEYLEGDIKMLQKLQQHVSNFDSFNLNVKVPQNETLLVNLLINRLRKENNEYLRIEKNLKLGKISYSNEFLKKLFSKDAHNRFSYKPTLKQLFEDFVVRQGYELSDPSIDTKFIWWSPIDKIKERFLTIDYVHPFYRIDITPILLNSNLDEKEIIAKLGNQVNIQDVVQFKEFENDIVQSVKRAAGLIKATEFLGNFIADNAISEISFIEVHMIQQIRKYLSYGKRVFVKYLTWEYEKCPKIYSGENKKLVGVYDDEKFVFGYIPTGIYGHAPLIIPGESLVWHQRTEHRFNLMGKYNPALINLNIAHFLENKWFEYKYWETYCPGFLPKTKLLYDILPEGVSKYNVTPEQFLEVANKEFPNGWIIKGVWDYNGIHHRITPKMDIKKHYYDYKNSDFDKFREEAKKGLAGCEPVEDLNMATHRHPNFLGAKIADLLSDSSQTFVQQYLDLKREHRIECAGGACPMSCMEGDEDWETIDSKKKIQDLQEDMQHFFMQCINTMPANLRGISLTSDVAKLNSGGHITIETNPGGNGWNIHNVKNVITGHNRLLRRYHEFAEYDPEGIQKGMTEEEQIIYQREMLKKWNVSYEVHGTHFSELPDRILDSITYVHPIRSDRLNYEGPRPKAQCIVSSPRKIASISKGINFWKQNVKTDTTLDCEDILHHLYYLTLKSKDTISTDLAQNITSEISKKYGPAILQKFSAPLIKFQKKNIKNGDEIEKSLVNKLSDLTLAAINHVDMLKTVGIPHNDFYELTVKFHKILTKERSEIIKYDKLMEKFQKYTKIFVIHKKLTKRVENMIIEIFDEFEDRITQLKAAERNNFDLNVSFGTVVKDLMEKMRNLYSFFILGEKKNERIYDALLHATLFLVHKHSDSIYALPKQNFLPEYNFLKFALKTALKGEDATFIGDIVHALVILGIRKENSKEMNLLISDSQCLIHSMQDSKKGSWDGDFSMLLSAVRAFKEHDLLESFLTVGEYSSNDEYFKVLEEEEAQKAFEWSITVNQSDYLFSKKLIDMRLIALFIGLIFTFIALCEGETNLMSLYHYSQTTFLNLKPKSRDVRINFHHESAKKQEDTDLHQIKTSLLGSLNKTKVEEINGGFEIQSSDVGTLLMSKKTTTTGFLKAPNGKRSQQGWILSKEDYPTDEVISGDMKTFKSIKKVLGNFNKFSIDILVKSDSKFLRNILINRIRKENTEIINESENDFVKTKLQYSEGFIEKLVEKNEKGEFIYNPTMEELFNDFIIRQGLESHNKKSKDLYWSKSTSMENLKKEFLQMTYIHPEYNIDITPILLNQNFDESISKKFNFIEKGNFIRFNEFKSLFIKGIKRAAGLVKSTEFLGHFIADNAISEISFLEVDFIQRIRNYLRSKRRLHIKYIVMNVEECPKFHNSESWSLRKWYNEKSDDFVLGYIESNVFGHAPLIIPGDAVIWHQRAEHRFNLLAKYNPSLINMNIIHFLENKWFEYKFWEEYCPKFLPKTKLLLDVLPEGISRVDVPPEIFVKIANEHFPNGWIIKGVWDYNGINHIITNKLDIVKLHQEYKNSTFDSFMNEIKTTLQGCEPIEDINLEAKSHPNFVGWKIGHLLKNAASTFIQEFKPLQRENRIECSSGECPLDCMDSDDSYDDSTSKTFETKKKINNFFMTCINSLPENLRGIPLTSDAAILKSDSQSFVTIETNPGGNGFGIHNDKLIAKCHNNVLRKFPNKYKFDRTLVTRGIESLEKQMIFLHQKIEQWNINMEIVSPQFLPMLKDRFIDSAVKLHSIRMNRLNYQGKRVIAPPVLRTKARGQIIENIIKFFGKHATKFCERTPELLFETLYYLKLHKELNEKRIVEFTKTVEEQCSQTLVTEFAQKMKTIKAKKFKKKISKKYQIHSLGKIILSINQRVAYLKMFNIPHSGIKEIADEYSVLLNKYFFDWKKILFPKLQKTLSSLKVSFEREGVSTKVLKKATKALAKIPKNLKAIKMTERSGYRIPAFSFLQITDNWDYLIRDLYSTFDQYSQNIIQAQNKYHLKFHHALVKSVVSLIVESSDSLYSLNPNFFRLENMFLQKILQFSIKTHDFEVMGDVVYALYLLNDKIDDSLKELIEKAKFLIYYKESGTVEDLDPTFHSTILAALKTFSNINLPKTGLKFGEILTPNQFWNKLKQLGWKINN
eukprot:gene11250-4069_t